jgi:hypothetical protein
MPTRLICLTALVALAVVACGDDPTSATVFPTTTTVTVTTTTTTPAAPTTTQPPTAADSLADYFAATATLMSSAETASAMLNQSWQSTGTIDAATEAAIAELDTAPLRALIPAGLDPALEVAVLAVFADLDSVASSLAGAVRFASYGEDLDVCLGLGSDSLERHDADRSLMLQLASTTAAPTAAADSPEAGVLAVRLEAIHSMNWGCDSCGGVAYDQAIPVDWDARTVLDGVGFEPTLVDGRWEISILAC